MLRDMGPALDHVVVIVPALGEAVRRYTGAGFVVTPGGRHDAIPTENAVVAFADGSYLELLAVRDDESRASLRLRSASPGWAADLRRASAIGRRFLPRLVGPSGVADVVLRRSGLARFADEARRQGFPMTGPVAMARQRPDGARLEWALVLPAADHLPFLIEDVTPRALRVPSDGAACAHPNGARGVAAVTVRAVDVPQAAFAWADLFGARLEAGSDGGTRVALDDLSVAIAPGEPEGAIAVTLRGVGVLPADVIADGLRGGSG
jgi:hypothetical protein